MKLPVASKAYAAGMGSALATPVKNFVTNTCLYFFPDGQAWCDPLGEIVAIGVGFALTYLTPSHTEPPPFTPPSNFITPEEK